MNRESLRSVSRLLPCLALLLAFPAAAHAAVPVLTVPVANAQIVASETANPGGSLAYAAPVTFTFSGAAGRGAAMLITISGRTEPPSVTEVSAGQYATAPVSLGEGAYSWQVAECGLAVDTVNNRCLSMPGQTNDVSETRSFTVTNPAVRVPALTSPANAASVLSKAFASDTGGIGYASDLTLAFAAATGHSGVLQLVLDGKTFVAGDVDGTIREVAAGSYELQAHGIAPGAHSWRVLDCARVGASSNSACAGSPNTVSSDAFGFTVGYPPARVVVAPPRSLVSVRGVPILLKAIVQKSAPGSGRAGVRVSLMRGVKKIDSHDIYATVRGVTVAFNPRKAGRYVVVVTRNAEGAYKGWTRRYAVTVAARQPVPRVAEGSIGLPRGVDAATTVRVRVCAGRGALSIKLKDSIRAGTVYPGKQRSFSKRQSQSCQWHTLQYRWGDEFDESGGIGTYKVAVDVTDAYGQRARSRSFSVFSGD